MVMLTPLTLLLLVIAVTLYLALVTYVKWCFGYFRRRNIPYLPPQSFLGGSLEMPQNRTTAIGMLARKFYAEMRAKHLKYCGIYFSLDPVLFINDLELLKCVLAKDFRHFTDRGLYFNEDDDPLSGHLVALGGVKWRTLRTKFTPTFTSGKIRMMFGTLTECSAMLQRLIDAKYVEKHKPIDIKNVLECFTIDVIGSCAFGLECRSFQDQNSPFRTLGKKFFMNSKQQQFKEFIFNTFPNFAKSIRMRRTPKDVHDFFLKLVADTVEYREMNNIMRNDFLQSLIEIKNTSAMPPDDLKHISDSDEMPMLMTTAENEWCEDRSHTLTMEEVAAQCFLFFAAGYETSSTLMTFALYELAKNPDIQDRVRRETFDVMLKKHNGQITYEAINDLQYMNQVLDETLRKYPPIPFVTRQCVNDYKMPGHDLIIKKGEKIRVPIVGIHYDPEYYPDPEQFDPERFSEANKQARHSYMFLPFGEGPRTCIGKRFGLMQAKVGLTTLLKDYKFTVNPRTKEPLTMDVNAMFFTAEGGIWLNIEKNYK